MRRIASLIAFFTAVFAVALHPVAVQARPIVSIDVFSGILHSVDPFTGTVTALGPSGTFGANYFPISASPVPYSYFALSPINHYLLKYPQAGTWGTPDFALWEAITDAPFYFTDYAFDSSTGRLFALTPGSQRFPASLLELHDTGAPIPFAPNSHALSWSSISQAPAFPVMTLIEAIDGVGLFGTDGIAAYLIDEVTGSVTALPPLIYDGPLFTGIAYDPDSGRLIGVAGLASPIPGSSSSSQIFRIEPMTGEVTLLNADAPALYGLAGVNVPEPCSFVLMTSGIAGLMVIRRRGQMPCSGRR